MDAYYDPHPLVSLDLPLALVGHPGSGVGTIGRVIAITGARSHIVYEDLPPDDPKVRRPDISLARRGLDGWEPRVSVEDGLQKTCDYFRKELGIAAGAGT